ncbi:glycosyl hydrolase family 65 protein [Kitasatospora sp. MAP12-22]|uniref:glycosyl hydrolase family 65 protein n=1 Tax=unclassified Kitasatospora TaxID=2633591 RepID=UPI0035166EE4
MAGAVDLLHRCYTGLEIREDTLWLDPRLPSALGRLELDLRYRGHWGVRIAVDRHTVTVSLRESRQPPVRVAFRGSTTAILPGRGRPCLPGRNGPAPPSRPRAALRHEPGRHRAGGPRSRPGHRVTPPIVPGRVELRGRRRRPAGRGHPTVRARRRPGSARGAARPG